MVGVVGIGAKSQHGQAIRANPAKVCQREIEGEIGVERKSREGEKEREREGKKKGKEKKRGDRNYQDRLERKAKRERHERQEKRKEERYTDAAKGISRIS